MYLVLLIYLLVIHNTILTIKKGALSPFFVQIMDFYAFGITLLAFE